MSHGALATADGAHEGREGRPLIGAGLEGSVGISALGEQMLKLAVAEVPRPAAEVAYLPILFLQLLGHKPSLAASGQALRADQLTHATADKRAQADRGAAVEKAKELKAAGEVALGQSVEKLPRLDLRHPSDV